MIVFAQGIPIIHYTQQLSRNVKIYGWGQGSIDIFEAFSRMPFENTVKWREDGELWAPRAKVINLQI